ncbi:MAG: hypothetical protein AABZ47_06365 [Planctomycetota bacterium]
MKPQRTISFVSILSGLAGLFLSPSSILACAVCFGDPDSPMTKGAAAGILVLGGFISSVLLGIVSVIAFWFYRSRVVSRQLDSLRAGIS